MSIEKKEVVIREDTYLLGVATVKATCECGWVEKMYADRHAVERAGQHLRTSHGGGRIKIGDYVTEINQ